jgi:hypothetical protein
MRQALIELARSGVMAALSPLEQIEIRRSGGSMPGEPPCFILGAPRSGTTLLYELMLTRYRFAFVSNLAHRFYRTPVTVTRLGRRWIRGWRGNFSSQYGHIAGWGAPSEGGSIWNRWFPEPSSLDEGRALQLPRSEIVGTVAGIASTLGAPFLNKNVMHSVHMRLLDAFFPGCAFIAVRRDPLANVRSILHARETDAGSESDGWWSVKPDTWRKFRHATKPVQAAAQVHFVLENIERNAIALGRERCLVVDYAEICEDAHAALDRIGVFLRSSGWTLEDRGAIPREFPMGGSAKLEERVEEEVREALKRFGAT